jgi:hypothetical protein
MPNTARSDAMAYVLGDLVTIYNAGATWTLTGTPAKAMRVTITDYYNDSLGATLIRCIIDGVTLGKTAYLTVSGSGTFDLSDLTAMGGAPVPDLSGLTLSYVGDYDEPGTLALSFEVTSSTASTSTASLSALRDTVRQRCDMVGSEFVTDDELDGWINASAHELYDILVQKFSPGSYYVAPTHEFTADGTSDSFALPGDMYKLLGVDMQLAADSWTTVKPFAFAERNRYAYPNVQSATIPANVRYRIMGGNLLFTPRPTAGQVFRLWYVPKMTLLQVDTDVLDGVSGWEEYVVADVCIKALTKEESDPSVFLAQKAALLQRIESAAENRDAGSPATVADSQGADFVWTGNGVGGWR